MGSRDNEVTFERFVIPVQRELEEVEERIGALRQGLSGDNAFQGLSAKYLQPAAEHLLRPGGKLLRPLLVLLAARAIGALRPAARPSIIRAAAAVELIHTASLIHDDMVDGAALRRGRPSLHAAFGNTAAILVGDLLYSRFFQELIGLPDTGMALRVQLLDAFLAATGRMCEGEIVEEQLRSQNGSASLEDYLNLSEAKTAELSAACCFAGGLLNGGSESAAAGLAGFGRALGLLFQIADDLADGDGVFPYRDQLLARGHACKCAAEDHLKDMKENDAVRALREMPGFLLP